MAPQQVDVAITELLHKYGYLHIFWADFSENLHMRGYTREEYQGIVEYCNNSRIVSILGQKHNYNTPSNGASVLGNWPAMIIPRD
jgi:hypothetical protein